MPNETLTVKAARVVTPNAIIENACIVIEDGRIARITKETKASASHDLGDATLLPGFVDLHIHGAVGVDVTNAATDGVLKVARYLATQGTTAWLPTFVPAADADYVKGIRAIDEVVRAQVGARGDDDKELVGARVVGVHYEGPFVNHAQCGALRTKYFKSYTKTEDLSFMIKLESENAVHLTTVAPEIENGIELIKRLIERGFKVAIGHTRADVETLDAASVAGARHVTHLFNAMTGLHHRAPGVVGWALTNDDVTCDVIADLVHAEARALNVAVRCKGVERTILISDAVAPTGLGDGEYRFWDDTIKVINRKTENERGDIAGSVIMMLDAVRVMRSLGASWSDIARMSATNPARVLGIDKETGSIQAGKHADLIALDESGEVVMTIIGGRVIYNRLGQVL